MRRSKSQNNVMVSDQTCTICIAISLCLWLSCVLLYVSLNSNEESTSFKNPFTSLTSTINKNLKLDTQTLSTPVVQNEDNQPSLSYFESISPELTASGWKPIYIHTLNVRMPIEEMDYLLETYWYPNIIKTNDIQENKIMDETQKDGSNININMNNNEGIDDDIDFSKLKRTQKKRKKHKIMDKEEKTKQISTTSDIKYPSDWSISCYPSKLYNKQCISQHMKYWSKGVAAVESKASIKHKYVTFLKDCGGFNNIRQGFEFHVMVAWITNRTLVLPPDTPWYLIDTGDIKRGKQGMHATEQTAWPYNEARMDGTSNFDIWFDLDDMSLVIPCITTSEFIRREYDNLHIPHKYYGDIVNKDQNIGREFMKWLTKKATELNVNVPWAQLNNVLYWPSMQDVQTKNSEMINAQWIDTRKGRTYTPFLQQQPFIHFPSCEHGLPDEDPEMSNYRYLGQIARSIAFDSSEMDRKYKQILRDHVHLKGEIMEYAALVISLLGAFKYSSLHIRRNELQYEYVWCSGEDSYKNIKPLIGEKEVLYIATDETQPDFFKVFEENGKRKVFQWKDFFGPDAQFEETKDIEIDGKLHGEVEMVICAMGRLFFGTKESTFSSYIERLRGYFNAPYTQILYHHYKLTEDVEESSTISRTQFAGKPYKGRIYKMAFKDLWEDIQHLP